MQKILGGVTAAKGFKAGGLNCGIKKSGKPDLALICSEVPAVATGVFTTNKVKAAPVLLSQKHLTQEKAQVILINSGNANACTGKEGLNHAKKEAQAVAKLFKITPEEVLLASTGVIGIPLPVNLILKSLPVLVEELSKTGGHQAAKAIMTTDTFPKEYAIIQEINGQEIRIGGMCKGSGMIQPNMATMLGIITTDASIERTILQKSLQQIVKQTFNRITVDGDTSTNDTVFLLANGAAGGPKIKTGPELEAFMEGLYEVASHLAQMIVKDGEGATKFLTIQVKGARSEEEAEMAARTVANSSLVKTAFFGEDANWGRIIAAVGYSGIDFSPEQTEIFLGNLLVYSGTGLVFDEAKAKNILQANEIDIIIDLKQGEQDVTVWTCDLSYDYVKINGSYRS